MIGKKGSAMFQGLEKMKGGGPASFQALEKRVGYRFKDKQRLKAALTHPSYRYENPEVPTDYQRLEFLGDSVLGFLAADALMQHHPDAPEGGLTQLKSAITSGQALAKAASELGLGDHLLMGRGEAAADGAGRESNLEDALEALMGAIWLDGGLKAARKFFERHIFQTLETAEAELTNPKGTLQEYAQKEGFGIPGYAVVEEGGPDHDRHFKVQVTVSTFVFRGEGRSRREAEKDAAAKAVHSFS